MCEVEQMILTFDHFTLSQVSEYTPSIDALLLEDLSEHYISIHNSIPSSLFPSDFQPNSVCLDYAHYYQTYINECITCTSS